MTLWIGPACAAGEASLAWLREGRIETRTLDGGAAPQANSPVPLGSLWKLYVYAWLADTEAKEAPYACKTGQGEERYCCTAGQSVARDQALARSCALYFSPARLGLQSDVWQAYWRERGAAAWLQDLKRLQPETEIPLASLLESLNLLAPRARNAARSALLETGLSGYGHEAWPQLGTGLRYKTYSWHRRDGIALGGAAGWLADGTPFWFGARGASRNALTDWAGPLAANLPQPDWRQAGVQSETACVDVDFFARYPLRAVWREKERVSAGLGHLQGRYRLEFANGNWLTIDAAGSLELLRSPSGQPRIRARLGLNDYVARVIDREGQTQAPQAARALGIAARTYLLQNGRYEGGCWRISDASQTQRVSPNPPSTAALAAAWFSDEVTLSGAPVQYHLDAPGANRMAWQDALAQAGKGWRFDRILAAAYPQATLGALSGRLECRRLQAAEDWLQGNAARWRRKLQSEPGFDALPTPPQICALHEGHPYADQRRLRIYARGWRTLDERVTLTHEYLHLVFRFHPNGADEIYIERLARRLIEG